MSQSVQERQKNHILQACALLFEPGQVVELRAIDATTRAYRIPHVEAGYFQDLDALAEAAVSLDAKAVYVCLNPMKPALLARASNRLKSKLATTQDHDVERRRWLLVDVDPVRPADISSSDEEHAGSRARAEEIRAALLAQGWPEPVLADSGNGTHLLWRVDLPNDDASRDLLQKVLEALDARWSDEAQGVDRKVFNASRICKLYGTMSRKGDSLPDRPHRYSHLLHVPEDLRPVPHTLLRDLAGTAPEAPAAPARRGYTGPAVEFDLDAWVGERCRVKRGPFSWNGGRKWILEACPWNAHDDNSMHILQHASGAISAGCSHNSCAGKGWHDLRDELEPGWADRRAVGLGGERPRLAMVVNNDRRTEGALALKFDPRQVAEQVDLARQEVEELVAGAAADPGAALKLALGDALASLTVLAKRDRGRYEAALHDLRDAGLQPAALRSIRSAVNGTAKSGEKGEEKPTPAEIGMALQEDHRFLCVWEELRVYRDGYYQPDAEAMVRKFTQDTLGADATSHDGNEVVYWLRTAVRVPEKRAHKIVNAGRLIPVLNGMLDPVTEELHPHSDKHLYTFQLPVRWDPNAYHQRADQFLDEVLPQDGGVTRALLEECTGYALHPDCRFQKATLLYGPRGRNGKGVFLEWLRAMLGPANVSSVKLQDIGGDNRFRAVQLAGKVANICTDLPRQAIRETGDFKALVAGEPIQVEQKGLPAFDLYNRAKLFFSANEMPSTDDRTQGFYRRWNILPFLVEFPEDDPRNDPDLLDKLRSPEGLSYLLLLAVRALQRLVKRGRFVESPAAKEQLDAYKRETDVVAAFINENVVAEFGATVGRTEIYLAFKTWCDEQGIRKVLTAPVFGKQVRQHFPAVTETRPQVGKKRLWMLNGLRLAGEVESDPGLGLEPDHDDYGLGAELTPVPF